MSQPPSNSNVIPRAPSIFFSPSVQPSIPFVVATFSTLAATWAGWHYWRHDPVAIWLCGISGLLIGFWVGEKVDWAAGALAGVVPDNWTWRVWKPKKIDP